MSEEQPQSQDQYGLYEVLVEEANGHRAVHRLNADSQEAAVAEVEQELAHGTEVIDFAPAGRGLGSRQ
jgi:hypothetical protein